MVRGGERGAGEERLVRGGERGTKPGEEEEEERGGEEAGLATGRACLHPKEGEEVRLGGSWGGTESQEEVRRGEGLVGGGRARRPVERFLERGGGAKRAVT